MDAKKYIEREATCADCVHFEACKSMLKELFPTTTDEEIYKATSSQNDCRVFKPAADVVEVVRCKNCMYGKQIAWHTARLRCTHPSHMNSQAPYEVSPNHFCADGRRTFSVSGKEEK